MINSVTPSVDPADRAKVEGDIANPPAKAPEPASETPTEADPSPPEDSLQLPEGFDSWEAYGQAVAKGEVTPPEKAPEDNTEANAPEIKEALGLLPEESQEAGQAILTEAYETGDLSAESRAKAAELWGVTPEMVDVYMKGYASETTDATQQVIQAAGGSENWDAFTKWAEEGGLSSEEREAFNSGLETDPTGTVTEALTKFRESGGGPGPKDVTRSAPSQAETSKEPGYESIAQMKQDMSDPKYASDPAFREKVARKIDNSNIFS